ncbi:hypothetical protein [Anabaena azotica]|uniref:Uncharacterized protein n=1 Tax=Anabaena azotica FACHB-119 TaxID=947527 RepID=A0ABR8DAN0_9NOST|nr:hypothetical protein [Anabaena azotica]MBD2504144.1 hypothetical protein [Anabaena azotica FACHB-119]
MFFGYIERELLWIENAASWQNTQLPENLHLHNDKGQRKADIWECHCEEIQEAVKKQSEKKLK